MAEDENLAHVLLLPAGEDAQRPAFPLGFRSVREARRDENTRVQTRGGTVYHGTVVYEIIPGGPQPTQHGYFLREDFRDGNYGPIRNCWIVVARPLQPIVWEVTGELATVKEMSWQRIRARNVVEDPMNEIAALTYLNQVASHRNIMRPKDILQDDAFLFIFMPYYSYRSLETAFYNMEITEEKARQVFRKIIDVSE